MKIQYYPYVLLFMMTMPGLADAQVNYLDLVSPVSNTGYGNRTRREKEVIANPIPREADAKFSRKIIRCIDARQKMNKQIEWPKNPLSTLLYAGLAEGAIIAYKSDSLNTYFNNVDFKLRGRL